MAVAAAAATIPKPQHADSIDALAEALDAATHAERLDWMRRVGGRQIKKLFVAAEGRDVSIADLVAEDEEPVVCEGKNGLPLLFNRFAKVFARANGRVVGWNRNPRIVQLVIGPGHFSCYDAREDTDADPGEVVIDYRSVPAQTHPSFPPLRSNDRGIPMLVYGGMYDKLRRVSQHVFVGDSFREYLFGAPFLLVRPPR